MSIDNVYTERAALVACLARLFPSSLEQPSDAEPGFSYAVYIQSSAGQLSWHVADEDLPLFDGVPRDLGMQWDGHDTVEKYHRLAHVCRGDTMLLPRNVPEPVVKAMLSDFVEACKK